MALRFAYKRFPTASPAAALGGQTFRLRPAVWVGVHGPSGTQAIEALLDTGSDDTTFKESLAPLIGVDLTHAPTRYLTGIGPAGHRVRYAAVRLRLTDGTEFRDWPAVVAFTDARLPFAVVGHAGGLQFFTATFGGHPAEIELAVNPTYPGT